MSFGLMVFGTSESQLYTFNLAQLRVCAEPGHTRAAFIIVFIRVSWFSEYTSKVYILFFNGQMESKICVATTHQFILVGGKIPHGYFLLTKISNFWQSGP
jgi:hypothetical protein